MIPDPPAAVPPSLPARASRGTAAAVVVAVFAVALATRLAIVFTTDRALAPMILNDEGQYFELAKNVAAGDGLSVGSPDPQPTAIRTPGYPVILALAFVAGGPTLRAGLVVGALADAVTAGLASLLVLRLLGTGAIRCAIAGGLGWALLSPYLWWMDILYPDPVGAMLLAAGVLASLEPGRGVRGGAVAGFLWGGAVLTRPFLLVAALGSLSLQHRRAAIAGLAALALAILPWTARNAAVFGRLIPLSTGGTGMNLWVGTWNDSGRPVVEIQSGPQGAVGGFSAPYYDSEDERIRAEAAWNAYMGEFLRGGGMAILESDARLREIAMERIRRDPLRWIMLRMRNVLLAWSLPDVPRGRWIGLPILALAVVGAVRLARAGRRREVLLLLGPPLLLAATLFPLRTEGRYVAAAAPILFALAGMALARRGT